MPVSMVLHVLKDCLFFFSGSPFFLRVSFSRAGSNERLGLSPDIASSDANTISRFKAEPMR